MRESFLQLRSSAFAARPSATKALVVFAVMLSMFQMASLPTLAVGGLNGTLSGRVVDDSGAAVGDVKVTATAPSGSYGTTTQGSGQFSIAGVALDTYTVSFQKQGYEAYSLTGVTVIGDQTVGLGAVKLAKQLRTIGRVAARSATGAYQPTATQDTFVFNGARLQQALGKNFATDQNALVASSPGTQINRAGNLSVRGSLTTEVGYNYDGIDYRSVSHGGAANGDTVSSQPGVLNGIGSLSVNPGAGDPSLANGGAGVVNLVPKRGTRPAFGSIDVEAATGNFDHQFGAEYGFATPDGRISNYFSMLARNFDVRRGPYLTPLQSSFTSAGTSTYPFTAPQYDVSRSIVDNLFYKFGKNNSQSVQFLYQSDVVRVGYSRLNGLPYATQSPLAYAAGGITSDLLPYVADIGPLYPGQTSYAQKQAPASADDNQTNLLKLEYNNNINASTFLALRLYRTTQYDIANDYSGQFFNFGPSRAPQSDGGGRSGAIMELTKLIGANNNVTLSTQYELDRSVFGISDYTSGLAVVDGQGVVGRTDWPDFLQPANRAAPLTFGAGTANACPVDGGCWLYYVNSTPTINGQANPDYGFFKSGVPRIPPQYVSSPNNPAQIFGVGLRDQIALSGKLHLDAGIRYEGTNYHFPPGILTGNIGPDADTNTPREWEPKISVAYNPTPADAIRVGFGRSAIFVTPGNLFTPVSYNYYLSNFPSSALSLPNYAIPGTSFVAGTVPARCGSGEAGGAVPFRACTSYADMLRWEEDNAFPDNGNGRTSTYNNYELSYSHQFPSGYAFKVTPFYRQGYNIAFNGVAAFVTDPVTGAVTPTAFRSFYSGFSKSSGVEGYLTTPERPTGLRGFVSMTYVNAISNRPAGAASEDIQPLVAFAVLAANNAYRVGYLSPFVTDIGVEYKFKNGLRVNPVFRYNRGFPYGVGNTTPVTLNGVSFNVPSTNNANSIPTNDVNSGTASGSVNFVDPTNPGNLLHPNLYATRGTPESSSPGGVLSHPRMTTDLTLELRRGNNTFGVQALNLGNQYLSQPFLNRRYQAIATGVSGSQSGQISVANPASPSYSTYLPVGTANFPSSINGAGPFLALPNSTQPLTYRFYYQLAL